MSGFIMDARVRMSIALALTASSVDTQGRQQQEASAKTLGMTGAEIDIARRGASFDALISFAMALAMASCAGDGAALAAARDRACEAGLSADICRQIEAYAIECCDPIA